jgi:hypothetical protein
MTSSIKANIHYDSEYAHVEFQKKDEAMDIFHCHAATSKLSPEKVQVFVNALIEDLQCFTTRSKDVGDKNLPQLCRQINEDLGILGIIFNHLWSYSNSPSKSKTAMAYKLQYRALLPIIKNIETFGDACKHWVKSNIESPDSCLELEPTFQESFAKAVLEENNDEDNNSNIELKKTNPKPAKATWRIKKKSIENK